MRTDESAEPPRFPGGIGDHTASMQLFGGIALALFHRSNTGEGTLVDANLLRAGLWGMGTPLMAKLGSKSVMELGPTSHVPTVNARHQAGTNPTFNNYRTKDGRWLQMLGLGIPPVSASPLSPAVCSSSMNNWLSPCLQLTHCG